MPSNLHLARCDECPLRKTLEETDCWVPVPAELNESDTIVIGEAPGKTEVEFGKPFIGRSGVKIVETLEQLGYRRHDVAWTNAVACRYPNDDDATFQASLEIRNRHRIKKGEKPWLSPEVCCRPRFEADVADYTNYLVLGASALRATGAETVDGSINHNPALTGKTGFRGTPARAADGSKLLATLHPEYVLRDPEWEWIFDLDVAKAFRWFRDELTWKEPDTQICRSPEQLAAFLDSWEGPLVYDVETHAVAYDEDGEAAFDPLRDALRCIGIGNRDRALIIPFKSVDGVTFFWNDEDYAAIRRLMQRALTEFTTIGWNSGYYDRMVVESSLGVTPPRHIDGILLSKLADSTLPQGLGFRASVHLDAPAWKSEHTASTAKTDEELWLYNGRDVAVTDLVVPVMKRRAVNNAQVRHYNRHAELQDVCVGMHKLGVRVNEERRQYHHARLTREANQYRREADRLAGRRLNPRSSIQLAELFYDDWALPVPFFTNKGRPSTDGNALRELLGNPLAEPEQKEVIKAIIKARKALQLMSHFTSKWKPGGRLVDRQGNMHPDFNATGTVGWRYSAKQPNPQNIPWILRDCIEPHPGYAYVYADYDQIELRLAAAIAKCLYYMDLFGNANIDAHNGSGEIIFGRDRYYDIPGSGDRSYKGDGGSPFERRRTLIKRFVYAVLYGADVETILKVLHAEQDGEGNYIFLEGASRIDIVDVRVMRNAWLRHVREFEQWWKDAERFARKNNYIEDPVWGLRRYFHPRDIRGMRNEIINTAVQFGAGALVHTGMFRMLEHVPFVEHEGLAIQVHDSLFFSVKEDRAEEIKKLMNELLVIEALGMKFTAESKIKRSMQ